MKPNFSLICRILVVFLFFILFISNSYSQSIGKDIDFKYKVVSEKIDNEFRYTVTITVNKGEGPFSFELCDKALALGGKSLEKSEDTNNKSFVFSNLAYQEYYYVYVYLPNQQIGIGKKIQLK